MNEIIIILIFTILLVIFICCLIPKKERFQKLNSYTTCGSLGKLDSNGDCICDNSDMIGDWYTNSAIYQCTDREENMCNSWSNYSPCSVSKNSPLYCVKNDLSVECNQFSLSDFSNTNPIGEYACALDSDTCDLYAWYIINNVKK